jgi:anti-sigma regulatory factor (Ser/Thr protein kinase)
MTAAAPASLVHQAFLYESQDAFVAELAPFVRAGLERGDTVFAASKRPNVDALREELGDDAERVQLEDTTEWQTEPYERLQSFRRLVDELPAGTGLSALGEPVWAGSPAVVRQWARYESIINLALADAPMRFVCLYDSASLPDEILRYAVHTHPEQLHAGETIACEQFAPPSQFQPGHAPMPPPGAGELPLAGHAFRRAVAKRARAAGVRRERVEKFVLAAHEVLTNAQRHGRPPVRVHIWVEDRELVCRVADGGSGVHDPLAGWLPPADSVEGGWGLPMARQLCDSLEIQTGGSEAAVAIYLSLDGAATAAAA